MKPLGYDTVDIVKYIRDTLDYEIFFISFHYMLVKIQKKRMITDLGLLRIQKMNKPWNQA